MTESRPSMPHANQRIIVQGRYGTVSHVRSIHGTVLVRFEDETTEVVPVEQVTDPVHVPGSEVQWNGSPDHAACSDLFAQTGGPDDVTCPDCLESFPGIFPGAVEAPEAPGGWTLPPDLYPNAATRKDQ